MSVLDFDLPKFTDTLVQCERTYNVDIVAKARQAKLTRDEFETALSWFHGEDSDQYAHILDLWDEVDDKYGSLQV